MMVTYCFLHYPIILTIEVYIDNNDYNITTFEHHNEDVMRKVVAMVPNGEM